MPKQTAKLDWQIVENDEAWERQRALFSPENVATTSSPRPVPGYWLGIAVLFLLLAGAGDWWWRATERKANQAAIATMAPTPQIFAPVTPNLAALVASLKQNHERMNGWYQLGPKGNDLRATIAAAEPTAHLAITVQAVNAQDDQAMVEVVAHSARGIPLYRQTRFYSHTTAGWQRTTPDVTLWGPEQSVATPYFLYHFRQSDAQVVSAIAPQIDALYIRVRRNLGLPILPTPDKLVIDVSVTQPPGQPSPWFTPPNYIVVSSPALYLAPVEVNDAGLLAQSLALPLLDQGLTQAVQAHAIGSPWQPMLNGLRLWQVWDLDLPLAAWRRDVVQWLYTDGPGTASAPIADLPAHYAKLCAFHQLWLPNPWQIALGCSERERTALQTVWWRQRHLPRRLAQLAVPVLALPSSALGSAPTQITYPGQTVVLATLIEYAVTIYGRERLPALLAGLGHYNRWETLIPATYGVSAVEFETGWHAYLATHYGVTVAHENGR